jgi:hypothetical protein
LRLTGSTPRSRLDTSLVHFRHQISTSLSISRAASLASSLCLCATACPMTACDACSLSISVLQPGSRAACAARTARVGRDRGRDSIPFHSALSFTH